MPGVFRRIEPGRRQRDMRGIDELAVRRLGRFRAGRQDTERGEAQQVATRRARGGRLGEASSSVASRRAHAATPCYPRSGRARSALSATCLIVTSSYGAE